MTYILTFYLTYILTFYLTYIQTFYLGLYLTYILTFYLTYTLTFYLTYILTFYLGFYLHKLCDINTDILSGSLSAYTLTFYVTHIYIYIYTDILSGSLSDIYIYILTFYLTYFLTGPVWSRSCCSGPVKLTAIWHLQWTCIRAHCDLVRAVAVWLCSLRSATCSCGPDVPTAIWQSSRAHSDLALYLQLQSGTGSCGGEEGGEEKRRKALIKSSNPHLPCWEQTWVIEYAKRRTNRTKRLKAQKGHREPNGQIAM